MERLLRSELDAIARDRASGAAELALRAVHYLQSWLCANPQPRETEMLKVARALLRTQPTMAPFWRLANDVALAIDTSDPGAAMARKLAAFRLILRTGPERIARNFFRALPRKDNNKLLTYSYSSTVARALIYARARIMSVYCSEGRPAYEGRRMAMELARAGIQVLFCTDAQLLSGFGNSRHIVLGADAILPHWFSNKVGTKTLIENARKARGTVWVLADTTKFVPETAFGSHSRPDDEEQAKEIWNMPPKRTSIFTWQFEPVCFTPRTRILTERGWMTPAQVRRELKKIPISPRLRALAD